MMCQRHVLMLITSNLVLSYHRNITCEISSSAAILAATRLPSSAPPCASFLSSSANFSFWIHFSLDSRHLASACMSAAACFSSSSRAASLRAATSCSPRCSSQVAMLSLAASLSRTAPSSREARYLPHNTRTVLFRKIHNVWMARQGKRRRPYCAAISLVHFLATHWSAGWMVRYLRAGLWCKLNTFL